jgi:carbon storage regulator
MLVLARKLNERIVIPCIQTAVQIVGIQGGIIRLGIEAPPEVKVFREEVIREGRDSAQAPLSEPPPSDLVSRLAAAAHDLAVLRRQLRGKLPASAAALLYRIDRDLTDLALHQAVGAKNSADSASKDNSINRVSH